VPSPVPAAGAQRPSFTLRSFWGALAGVVLAGVLLRVLYTLLEAPWPPDGLDDQFYFDTLPDLIGDGRGFLRPFEYVNAGASLPTAEHPPLHSLLLGALAKIGLSDQDLQRLTGTAFGAASIVVVALIARRLAGDRAGLLAAGLAALAPSLIATDGALMSESLFVLLVGLSLLATLWLLDDPGPRRALVVGASIALAALTRAEALLLVPLLLVPLLRRPAGLRCAAAALLACLVVLAPWTVRNWITFDGPVVVATNSGSAIGGANCPEVYRGDKLGGWSPACVRRGPGNEAQSFGAARTRGVDYAQSHPGRLPLVLGARLARVWGLMGTFQIPEGRSPRVQKAGVVVFFALAALAVAGSVRLRDQRTRLWVVLAPVLMASIAALLTYGNTRFRAPAELSAVALAAVALDAGWRRSEHLR
jgi:4-amino-4-deoxy-L-arabinose transferase-like glycosyltransferase